LLGYALKLLLQLQPWRQTEAAEERGQPLAAAK